MFIFVFFPVSGYFTIPRPLTGTQRATLNRKLKKSKTLAGETWLPLKEYRRQKAERENLNRQKLVPTEEKAIIPSPPLPSYEPVKPPLPPKEEITPKLPKGVVHPDVYKKLN